MAAVPNMNVVLTVEPAVYEIRKDCRYMVSVPAGVSDHQLEHLLKRLQEWLESDNPFLIVLDGVKLVRVDELERHTPNE